MIFPCANVRDTTRKSLEGRNQKEIYYPSNLIVSSIYDVPDHGEEFDFLRQFLF